MSVPPDLIAAYRAAVYEIDVAGHALAFQVDQRSPALDALLSSRGAKCAVLITAYNPRSRAQSEAQNAVAHGALIEAVQNAGKVSLPTRARDPLRHWPAEAGLFVFDLSRDEGIALAQRFDQNAIVWVTQSAPAVLVFAN